MSVYLFDSDVLIDFFKKKPYALELVTTLIEQGDLFASILSISELRSGWSEKEVLYLLPRFYKVFSIQPITPDIAELAGHFRHEFKKKGRLLPLIDTLIAATAINRRCAFVTNNKKDYPMSELVFHSF